MAEQPERVYDLEERTHRFAKRVREFVKRLPTTLTNPDHARQLGRCSGSIGANYIEANEALGKKDFLMRIRISRKESKEARHWLRLLDTAEESTLDQERAALIQEATELMKIFGAILAKSQRDRNPSGEKSE
jgi:four helix bundle protein